jgi:glycine/D-amino acid oxidase-like deaminating enzyme
MRHRSRSSLHPTPTRSRLAVLAIAAGIAGLSTLAILASVALAGCRHVSVEGSGAAGGTSGAAAASGGAPPSEAQRTRDMEKKAKDIEQQSRDVQNMQGSDQEKIDAVNKLDQQRQDLNRQSEATPADAGSPPSTPPPQ